MTMENFGDAIVEATVMYQGKLSAAPRAVVSGDELWLTLPILKAVSGWEMKPEGVCRDEACVTLPNDGYSRLLYQEGSDSWFNLSAFAQIVEQPVAYDPKHQTWCFGPLGWEWQAPMISYETPDFTLPDLQGRYYSLSQYRGKKVLLALWATW
ncbi:MAG: redoxin domain-containing protein [Chloroflexi bacterium]|nr:redoxin domain-containing protein [Chloroflexota bacterium]